MYTEISVLWFSGQGLLNTQHQPFQRNYKFQNSQPRVKFLLRYCQDKFSGYQYILLTASVRHILPYTQGNSRLNSIGSNDFIYTYPLSNKNGNFKGDKYWENEVYILTVVLNQIATITKNRYEKYIFQEFIIQLF